MSKCKARRCNRSLPALTLHILHLHMKWYLYCKKLESRYVFCLYIPSFFQAGWPLFRNLFHSISLKAPPKVKAVPAALIQKSLDVLMKYLLLDICVLLWAQSNLLKAFAKLMSCCKELSRSKVYCCRPEFSVKIFVQQ